MKKISEKPVLPCFTILLSEVEFRKGGVEIFLTIGDVIKRLELRA